MMTPTSMIKQQLKPEEVEAYKEAFDHFDWTKSGTIPHKELQYAMRRAGQNPTDVEVQDMINNIDDGTGTLDFQDFLQVMGDKVGEIDIEIHFKDTFRVFSKDPDGCIPANELKFVLMHLPGKIAGMEIEEMIKTVDKNGDGKISYSEFRVMMGGLPLIITDDKEALAKKQKEDEEKELQLANEKARRERGDYEYKG